MVHTDGTYQRYERDSEDDVTVLRQLTTQEREERVERIRALAGGGLTTWREAQTTGDLAERGPRRAALVQGLVRRWHHSLDLQLESVLERELPGEQRARLLVGVWLDVARATQGVRAVVAREGADLTHAQRPLLAMLEEDLRAAGAPDPARSARDLLREVEAVAAAEDRAGRPLPRERRALFAHRRPRRLPRLVWA